MTYYTSVITSEDIELLNKLNSELYDINKTILYDLLEIKVLTLRIIRIKNSLSLLPYNPLKSMQGCSVGNGNITPLNCGGTTLP